MAASWQRMPNKLENRQGTLLALVGSVLSFAVAIGCGLLVIVPLLTFGQNDLFHVD